MNRTERLVLACTLSLSLCAAFSAQAFAGQSPTSAPAGAQPLAALTRTVEAFADPSRNSRSTVVDGRRPITGEQTVLPVLAYAVGADHVQWLKALLPGRPNGHAGWILQSSTAARWTRWSLVVDLSARRVTVFSDGRAARSFPAVVGKPSTPTPTGDFFVEETVALSQTLAGAPYALATSARSDVLEQFEGGPGQIALHGTDNLAGVPGTAVSHGCVRLATANIVWMADRIVPGTRVTIVG
ncbi:MAG: L,D-transpeptidase [Solirubrobacteraceae bacterium]